MRGFLSGFVCDRRAAVFWGRMLFKFIWPSAQLRGPTGISVLLSNDCYKKTTTVLCCCIVYSWVCFITWYDYPGILKHTSTQHGKQRAKAIPLEETVINRFHWNQQALHLCCVDFIRSGIFIYCPRGLQDPKHEVVASEADAAYLVMLLPSNGSVMFSSLSEQPDCSSSSLFPSYAM